jgi:membrane fusion protein, multidrug efflux system
MDATTRIVHLPRDGARQLFGLSRKRLLWFAAGAALLGGAVWFGWFWWTKGRFIESTDDAYVGGEVTTLSSKVSGFIETVAVTDNQPIKAGDLLVKLDDRDYRAQLARAQASVEAQQATLANLEANRLLQQAIVEQAKGRSTPRRPSSSAPKTTETAIAP